MPLPSTYQFSSSFSEVTNETLNFNCTLDYAEIIGYNFVEFEILNPDLVNGLAIVSFDLEDNVNVVNQTVDHTFQINSANLLDVNNSFTIRVRLRDTDPGPPQLLPVFEDFNIIFQDVIEQPGDNEGSNIDVLGL